MTALSLTSSIFSIKTFLTKILSEQNNIIQEFALQIEKSGDVLPFMFIMLNNLSLDMCPKKHLFTFPIIDEHGTIGFALQCVCKKSCNYYVRQQ